MVRAASAASRRNPAKGKGSRGKLSIGAAETTVSQGELKPGTPMPLVVRFARNRWRSGAPRDLASLGQSSEANSSRCDDYKRADQASFILGDKIDNISADLATSPRRVSEQDDTKARLCVCENQLPEVLVFGQQEASIAHRDVSDFGVGCLCVRLSHCHDIVSGIPESPDHRIVAALVGQEAHCYSEC